MRAVVIYESMYGNTHKIAQYIASGLSTTLEVDLMSTADVAVEGLPQVDLIVVGGPTHVHGMTRPRTRHAAVDAARDPDKHLEVDRNADAPGVREWLDTLGSLDGWAASFDTRADGPSALTGRASRGIAKQLQRHGCSLLAPPESFLVSKDNVLLPGEDERAEAWGRSLAHRLMGGALATTP